MEENEFEEEESDPGILEEHEWQKIRGETIDYGKNQHPLDPDRDPAPRSRFILQAPIKSAEPEHSKCRFTRQAPSIAPFPAVHAIPNEIVVPSPFGIHSRNRKERLGYYEKPLSLRYGDIEMHISGCKLNVKDEDVFIALTELAVKKRSLEFTTTLPELCGRLYKSYAETSKDSIRNSLLRLRGGVVEIVHSEGREKKDENWIIGGMLSFAAKKDNKIFISLDPFFNRLFGRQLMTSINPQFRLSLKGDVTKQLYPFFQRQVSAKTRQERYLYKIGLEKLCNLIGLGRDKKQTLSQVRYMRYKIKEALEELKEKGYLRSHSLTPRSDVIHVVIEGKKRQQLQEPEIEEQPVGKEEAPAQRSGLSGVAYVEKQTGLKIRGDRDRAKAERKILKIQAVGIVLGNPVGLLGEFVEWLRVQHKEVGWLKSISSGTLDPLRETFGKFMAAMGHEMPSWDAIDRKFKLLTESEMEREERQKREREERQSEERRAQEWEQEQEREKKWIRGCLEKRFTVTSCRQRSIPIDSMMEEMAETVRELKQLCGDDWQAACERFVEVVEEERRAGRGSYSVLLQIGSNAWEVWKTCEEAIQD